MTEGKACLSGQSAVAGSEMRVRAAELLPGDRLVRQGLVVVTVGEACVGVEGRPVVVIGYDGGRSDTWLADRRFAVVRESLA